MSRTLRFSLLLLCVLLSGACSSTRHVDVLIRGADDLHPNSSGQPTPVKVWVLQVATPGAFETAEFAELSRDPAQALGGDVRVVDEHAVAVGMKTADVIPVVIDTKLFPYIGLVGRFRRAEGDGWRMLVDARQASSQIGVIVTGYELRAVGRREVQKKADEATENEAVEKAQDPDGTAEDAARDGAEDAASGDA
jgi:type VI secretion system VasD/TssJ family lipoprotein